MTYTVQEVASISGVSVRTLHYYDAIGLLEPHARNQSGYRLYTDTEVEKLQQILFYRELGFSLADIKAMIERPDFDRVEALESHRSALVLRRKRIARLIATIDRTVAAIRGEAHMEKRKLFEGFDVEAVLEEQMSYRQEVEANYDPKVVAESRRRTQRYTKAEWGRILKEGADLNAAIAALLATSVPPEDRRVQQLIRKHFEFINDRFYTCSMEIYRGLASLYVDDPRFRANYEKVRPGLADYMSRAMIAFSAGAGQQGD